MDLGGVGIILESSLLLYSRVFHFRPCALKTTCHLLGAIFVKSKIVCASFSSLGLKQHPDYFAWLLAVEDVKSVDLDLELTSLSGYVVWWLCGYELGGMWGMFYLEFVVLFYPLEKIFQVGHPVWGFGVVRDEILVLWETIHRRKTCVRWKTSGLLLRVWCGPRWNSCSVGSHP